MMKKKLILLELIFIQMEEFQELGLLEKLLNENYYKAKKITRKNFKKFGDLISTKK